MSDSEDDDVDNDGVKNDDDTCDSSPQGWVSDNLTDYDGMAVRIVAPKMMEWERTKMMTTTGFSIL